MGRKAADFDQFQVRLPPGMRERLKAAAEKHGRSMNAEIVSALEACYPELFSWDYTYDRWIRSAVFSKDEAERAALVAEADAYVKKFKGDAYVRIENGAVQFGMAQYWKPRPSSAPLAPSPDPDAVSE